MREERFDPRTGPLCAWCPFAAQCPEGSREIRRRLDAVIHCVSQQVVERILQRFEHLLVELDLAALHLELGVAADLAGHVADRPRQGVEHGRQREGLDAADVFLQLAREDGGLESVRLEGAHQVSQAPRQLFVAFRTFVDGVDQALHERIADRQVVVVQARAQRAAPFELILLEGENGLQLAQALVGAQARRQELADLCHQGTELLGRDPQALLCGLERAGGRHAQLRAVGQDGARFGQGVGVARIGPELVQARERRHHHLLERHLRRGGLVGHWRVRRRGSRRGGS